MGKSEKEKIAAAKSAGKKISEVSYSKTSKQGAPNKVDKIISSEAAGHMDTGRNTGAKRQTVSTPGNSTVGQAKTTIQTKAENALVQAAKVAAKTGENVQNIRSRIKTDVAKVASRAASIEARQKNHTVTKVDRKTGKSK